MFFWNLEKEPVVGIACTKEPRMLQIPKATISWLASTGFPPAKIIVVKMVIMSMILILKIMIKAVMTMITISWPTTGLLSVVIVIVLSSHSSVNWANFCIYVFCICLYFCFVFPCSVLTFLYKLRQFLGLALDFPSLIAHLSTRYRRVFFFCFVLVLSMVLNKQVNNM